MTFFPENLEDLQEIVKKAEACKRPLFPVSSAWNRTQEEPDGADIVSFRKMNRIRKVDRRIRYVRAEAGVTFGDLLPVVKKEGLRLNHPFLPRTEKSVVASLLERDGGIVPKYQYDFHDPLLNAEIVYGNGEVFRTGSAAGPGPIEELAADMVSPWGPGTIDFIRFVCGAQGTMGFVTWATMKAEVLPTMSQLYFITSDDPAKLTRLASDLLLKRVPDDCLILNKVNFAMAFAQDEALLKRFMNEGDPWILLCRICGYERYPEDRIKIYSGYLQEMAEAAGLKCQTKLPILDGTEAYIEERMLDCDRNEIYWKDRKGGTFESGFLAPPSKAAGFAGVVMKAADSKQENLGMTILPQVQGRTFRVSFDLYHDKTDRMEADAMNRFGHGIEEQLLAKGAYFESPTGPITKKIFEAGPAGMEAIKKLKNIFDPAGVFCPGSLCF